MDTEDEPLDPQPLAKVIWDGQSSEKLKPSLLVSFNDKIDPQEHIIFINNNMTTIGDSYSLKYKHMTRHSSNTIVGGGETSSAIKRYTQTVMHVRHGSPSKGADRRATITFSKNDSEGVISHEDDPMVIKIQI